MNSKEIKISVIHFTKLVDRAEYFKSRLISGVHFDFITEENLITRQSNFEVIYNWAIRYRYLKAIHLGHLSNLLKLRHMALFCVVIINLILQIELKIGKKHLFLHKKFLGIAHLSKKIHEVNLMHAKGLATTSNNQNFTIIFEDDAVFKTGNLRSNIYEVQKFIESNKNIVVFIAKPTAKVVWAFEDLIQFRKRFIRIIPPLSKGASAYILNNDLARKLSEYIKDTNINLPIDLLLTYWAHEMGVKIYWDRQAFISEGSGKNYKSSLR
jgi:hypothetical protein